MTSSSASAQGVMESEKPPSIKRLVKRLVIHIGSRTMPLFANSHYEHAYESAHLPLNLAIVVLRNADPNYLMYWHKLVPGIDVYNYEDDNAGRFLSDIVLGFPKVLDWLKGHCSYNTKLYVFFPLAKRILQINWESLYTVHQEC